MRLRRSPLVHGAALGLAFLVASCSDPLDAERDAFTAALARWQHSGIENYVFEVQRACFCGPSETRRMRIDVVGGEVVSAVYVDGGEPVPGPLAALPTVDALFEEIRDAIRREAFSIVATYDETLGYPSNVFIDYSENAVDEERGFTVSGFQRITVID